jgi:hypothetical protein
MDDTELWSAIVVASNSHHQLDDLFGVVDKLPVEDKVALVKHLLGNSGLSVVFENNQLSGSLIVQINTMDKAVLGEILQAIAQRITQE